MAAERSSAPALPAEPDDRATSSVPAPDERDLDLLESYLAAAT